TGRFQSFQRILENLGTGARPRPGETPLAFLPDALAMAKSLGGGLPMGAFWVRDKYADLLEAGTHGTTFGGTPLICAVALRVMEVIERARLGENARQPGNFLRGELQRLVGSYPKV